ncbi:MAG TPA: class I SAM-dependent methyltransferase [Solirubrobacterales bacterium]
MSAAIWHDVECGSYDADLPLWEELAQAADGPVLELGCGTGRVTLHLARRGHEVIGLDSDPELVAALRERTNGLPVEAIAADARDFALDEPVALVLAPMQFLQLLGDSEERLACLRCIAACLRPGGVVAVALVEEMPEPDGSAPPLPDVREVDGWVYSSLPTEAALAAGEIRLRRLRQTVSPGGELSEEPNEIRLRTFPADRLEAEAAKAGFSAGRRRSIALTDAHVGSVVSILEGAR